MSWAHSLAQVREAQKLRHAVFAQEMGARLPTVVPGHDIDRFDEYCEHLLVRDNASGQVIGTYRLLTPAQAQRAGGTYSDGEFDLTPLDVLRPRMVELGRSCVHPAHRNGAVILALWGALARFMVTNRLDTMVGSASIPAGCVADALVVAGIWNRVRQSSLGPAGLQVAPRLPFLLPAGPSAGTLDMPPPPLIKAYLRLGAVVLGPPAWDPVFRTADLPLLMRVADLPARLRQGAQLG